MQTLDIPTLRKLHACILFQTVQYRDTELFLKICVCNGPSVDCVRKVSYFHQKHVQKFRKSFFKNISHFRSFIHPQLELFGFSLSFYLALICQSSETNMCGMESSPINQSLRQIGTVKGFMFSKCRIRFRYRPQMYAINSLQLLL